MSREISSNPMKTRQLLNTPVPAAAAVSGLFRLKFPLVRYGASHVAGQDELTPMLASN